MECVYDFHVTFLVNPENYLGQSNILEGRLKTTSALFCYRYICNIHSTYISPVFANITNINLKCIYLHP